MVADSNVLALATLGSLAAGNFITRQSGSLTAWWLDSLEAKQLGSQTA